MSFKPALFSDDGKQLPLANEDELFILERSKISFHLTSSEGTNKGKGRIYCTTQRIIFVAEKGTSQHGTFFDAFEIPLKQMSNEKFNQPIFGACSLSGDVIPSDDAANEAQPYKWKIVFDNGGTGVVLPVFLRLIEKRKKRESIGDDFVSKVTQQKAFVDPNDPTVIYVSQPVRPVKAAAAKASC